MSKIRRYAAYLLLCTPNIKMVFGERKTIKNTVATFSDFEAVFFVKCFHSLLASTYPNCLGHETGTTHIFRLGLRKPRGHLPSCKNMKNPSSFVTLEGFCLSRCHAHFVQRSGWLSRDNH